MRRLMAAAYARRSSRKVRQASRGQTLLIFVLTFTSLLGVMGLAIDTVRVYDLYARMQRAAEAGALAGVIYMPNNYTTNLSNPPGDNAVCRAWQEIYKNSFGTGCTPGATITSNNCPSPTSVEIAVCPGNKPYDLKVTITEPIDVVFLSALGVGPVTISATAVAEYLPPVQIASDPSGVGGTGSWGTFGECGNGGTSASAACTGGGSRNWAGNINGPGELKEQGDPLVSCEEGPSTGTTDLTSATAETYTGVMTNHPQHSYMPPVGQPPTGCTNPDTSNVFSGPTYLGGGSRPGYAFYVQMPKIDPLASPPVNVGPYASLWIWNPSFDPSQPPSCNGRQSTGQTSYDIYYEVNCSGSGGSPYPYYPVATAAGTQEICAGQSPYTCMDPRMMFNVTYSITPIDVTNPTAGVPAATFQAYPLMTSGCGNGQYMLLASTAAGTSQGCVPSPCVTQWCPLPVGTAGWYAGVGDSTMLANPFPLQAGQDYRVMVTTSDYADPTNPNIGWGGHSYSMKLCPPTGVDQTNVQTCTTPAGASISGWNLSDTLFTFPGNGKGNGGSQTTEYPLGVIPSTYSGRTLDVSLYDPGDLIGGPNGVTVYGAVPNITGISDPCTTTSAQLTSAGYDPTINGSTFNFPNGEQTTLFNNNIPALQPTSKTYPLWYNGLWVDEQITLPANYAGGGWTLCAVAPQTNDSDVLGIKVLALGQSPVHLIH